MPNDIVIAVKAKDETLPGFRSATKASKDVADGFDRAGDAADNTYDKFDSLESVGRGTTDTMSGLAGIMSGDLLGGSTDLAGGVAALADGFKGALLPALKSAAGGMKAFTVSLLTNPIFLVVSALLLLGLGLATAYKHSETFRNGVNAVWNGIKAVVVPVLEAIWNGVKVTFEGFISVVTKLIRFLPGGSKLLDKLKEATDGAGDAMKDTGAAAETYEDQQKRLNSQIESATKELQGYIDALAEASGNQISAQESAIDLADAIANGTAAIKENGRTHDLNTEAGRKNQKALLDLASSANTNAQAMVKNGSTIDQAGIAGEKSRKNFLALAQQMGYSKAEAVQMAQKMLAIPNVSREARMVGNIADLDAKIAAGKRNLATLPKSKTAAALLDIRQLERQAAEARAELASIKSKTVTIRYTSTGVNLTAPSRVGGTYTGGTIRGFAGGGNPPPGMSWVGENGPELLELSGGTARVTPAGDSQRIARQHGGGGSTQLVLQLQPGGSALDQLFLNWLKNAIRGQGGDVQIVLGSS